MHTDTQHYTFDEIQSLLEKSIEDYLKQNSNTKRHTAIKNDTEFSEAKSILENMATLKASETLLYEYPKEYNDVQHTKKNITTFFNTQCKYLLHTMAHQHPNEKMIREKQYILDRQLETKVNTLIALVKRLQKHTSEENIEQFILFDEQNNIPMELLDYEDKNPEIHDLNKEDYNYLKRTEKDLLCTYRKYKNLGWHIISQIQ